MFPCYMYAFGGSENGMDGALHWLGGSKLHGGVSGGSCVI